MFERLPLCGSCSDSAYRLHRHCARCGRRVDGSQAAYVNHAWYCTGVAT